MDAAQAQPGSFVILTELPAGLLDGFPTDDQAAISEIAGKPVRLKGYHDLGRAELEFGDRHGIIHFIYVNPVLIRVAE